MQPEIPPVLPTPEELEFKRKNLPEKPGCYIYKDETGKVIYVGKAKSLKKRVNSYWKENRNEDPLYMAKIQRLVSLIRDIDIFVVENETEALLLENELIKKHQPHFNAMLKDDKSFPWVMITHEKFPRIAVIRGPERYGLQHKFLGPFVDALDLKRLIRYLRKIFPYCTCKSCAQQQSRTRPCIYAQIKLCTAPCSGKISPEEYMENINAIEQIMLGDIHPIQKELQKKMEDAAKQLDFETATIFRDRIQALENLSHEQSVLTYDMVYKEPQESSIPNDSDSVQENLPRTKDMDIIAGHFSAKRAGILIVHVKKGRLIGKTPYIVDLQEKITDQSEYYPSFIEQHYLRPNVPLPDEIIVEYPLPPETEHALRDYFQKNDTEKDIPKREAHDLNFRSPSEEDKTAGLMRIAIKNIELLIKQKEEYEQYVEEQHIDMEQQGEITKGLRELQEIFELEELPMIIEAFDISNIQGSDPVGSMITFVEGKPSKAHYRRFKIRSKSTPDDYAMMQEVVGRRYQRVKNEKQPLPDLILVDGGKGQLGVAHKILTDLELEDIPHIGLAKREEEIFLMDKEDPICLPKTSAALHILQAIRDEAHRFAVSYHRLLRKKRQTKSELDEIPGIGVSRKKKLLQYFGSLGELRTATIKEINDVIGDTLGTQVFEYLQAHPPTTPADLNPPKVFTRKKTSRPK